MNFVEFQDLLALPFVVSKKGRGVCFKDLLALPSVGIQEGKSSFAVHDIITFLFSSVSSFIMS